MKNIINYYIIQNYIKKKTKKDEMNTKINFSE